MILIQNHKAGSLSYEENHRYAYNMVLMKSGELLYKGTCELISANLDKLAKQDIMPAFPSGTGDPIQRSQEGEVLLKAVRKVWDDHTSSLSKLRDVLKYMVRALYTQHTHPNTDLFRTVSTQSQPVFRRHGIRVYFCL